MISIYYVIIYHPLIIAFCRNA